MLKYLFTAFYRDGSKFEQTDGDISNIDPTKSAFYDVDQNNLIKFELSDGQQKISVNLDNGSFDINGFPLNIGDDELPIRNNLRLIYYRQNTVLFGPNPSRDVVYCLGWQTTFNGKNYKKIIEFR